MHTTGSSNSSNNLANDRYAHSSPEDLDGPYKSLGVSPLDSNDSIDSLVELYQAYIMKQAKSMAYLTSMMAHSADLYVDPDDIAQEVSLSFWKQLKKGFIDNPEAYIRRITHNKYIDAMRRCHMNLRSLPVAENGELLEGEILITPGEGMADPAEEFERQTAINDLTERVANAVSRLPLRQQRAASRVLLKRVDNLLQIIEVFEAHQVTPEVYEGEDEVEKHRLQASFSPARLALAKELDINLCLYNRPRHYRTSSHKR
jgi:DNA-directed RNA polymerase specialized sigma24 family protein